MEKAETAKLVTREDVASFLADINRQIVESNLPPIHTLLALNNILSQSNANPVLDEELKNQARDIWLKIKATGVHLTDPPFLFADSSVFDGEDEMFDGEVSSEFSS